MNLSTFIVGLILLVIIALIIRNLIKKKGNTCGCGCGCENCRAACASKDGKGK